MRSECDREKKDRERRAGVYRFPIKDHRPAINHRPDKPTFRRSLTFRSSIPERIFAIIDFPIIDFSIIDPTPECTFPIMHHRPALPQSSDPTFSIIDFPIIDPERVQGTFAILYFFRSAIVFQVKFKCTFFDLTLLEFCVNLLI